MFSFIILEIKYDVENIKMLYVNSHIFVLNLPGLRARQQWQKMATDCETRGDACGGAKTWSEIR
jgi:hypothetical protein